MALAISFFNLFLIAGLAFYFYKRTSKKGQSEEILKELRSEINGLIADLDKVTDQNLELFDSKTEEIKQTLKKVDQKISSIKKLIDDPVNLDKIYDKIDSKVKCNKKISFDTDESLVANAEAQNKSDGEGETANAKNKKERVLLMFKKGESQKKIAKELNISLSEVEFIINIANRKK